MQIVYIIPKIPGFTDENKNKIFLDVKSLFWSFS